MTIGLSTPAADGVPDVVDALRRWQHDDAPVPLHPGDLGWHWRVGADETAAALRVWARDRQIVAIGLLDGPGLLRLAVAPQAAHDDATARRVAADVSDPGRGVLPEGRGSVEARSAAAFERVLLENGWEPDEPWTPLQRRLREPVDECGLRVETVGPQHAEVRAAVQRAAFDRSTFTAQHWRAMAAGVAYRDARCLIAYDDEGNAVATATVWSAGSGRPGLLEPVGVHRDHQGRGHGRAITRAAAAALRDLGASSAVVCTPSSNIAAVATYRSAGFDAFPEVRDLRRP